MRGAIRVALGVVAAAMFAAPAAADAAPSVTGEFALPAGSTVGSNNEIVEGPDGNIWVTTEQNEVVRIKPDGTVEGPFSTTNSVFGITAGPDGNLWVTTAIGVRKIPPGDPNSSTPFDIGLANGSSITAGPDGRLWVAGTDTLVRFDPADPEGTDDPTNIPGLSPKGMATGSDGLIWIADASGRIISATAADTPVVTPYTVDGGPQDVAGGANGQVAYANPLDTPHEVGLISPGGTPDQIPLETSDPFGVAYGNDGTYWIARSSTDDLLRLTPDGTTTKLTGFSASGNVGPRKITTGPNNTLWVTLDTQEKVARVSGVEPPAPPNPPPPVNPPATAPETTIDKGPKRKVKTRKRRAKVKFKFSSVAGATFECTIKRNSWRKPRFGPCSSPKKYKLKQGRYEFRVAATVAGLTGPAATQKFRIVRTK
jgi:streptogramin lyase